MYIPFEDDVGIMPHKNRKFMKGKFKSCVWILVFNPSFPIFLYECINTKKDNLYLIARKDILSMLKFFYIYMCIVLYMTTYRTPLQLSYLYCTLFWKPELNHFFLRFMLLNFFFGVVCGLFSLSFYVLAMALFVTLWKDFLLLSPGYIPLFIQKLFNTVPFKLLFNQVIESFLKKFGIGRNPILHYFNVRCKTPEIWY